MKPPRCRTACFAMFSDYVLWFLIPLASAELLSESLVSNDTFEGTGLNNSSIYYSIPENTDYPLPPSNLQEFVMFDKRTKHLEVNITWSPPNGGIPPNSYEVHFRALDQRCQQQFKHHYVLWNTPSVIIPKVESGGTSKVQLLYNCTYQVEVFSKPGIVNNSVTKTFRIEHCLPGDCYCHSREPLPPPTNLVINIGGESGNGNVSVEWDYPTNEWNISSFTVAFAKHSRNEAGLKGFQKYDVKNQDAFEDIDHYNQSGTVLNNKLIRITVAAVDADHCNGMLAEIRLECKIGNCICSAIALSNNAPTHVEVVEDDVNHQEPSIVWTYPSHLLQEVDLFRISVNNVNWTEPVDRRYNQSANTTRNHITSFVTPYPCHAIGIDLGTIQIVAVDVAACYSPTSKEYTYRCPAPAIQPEPPQKSDYTTAIVAIFCAFGFAGFVVMGYYWWTRRRYLKGHIKNNMRSRDRPSSLAEYHRSQSSSIGEGPSYTPHSIGSQVSAGTRLTYLPSELYQMSPIYLEKEIMDAIQEGKADHFEISFNRLRVGKEIGKGAFGRVFLATAEAIAGNSGKMYVAVKQLNASASESDKAEFLKEIEMMKKVGHHANVVRMLACCTIQHPLCMVMEHVPCGDLRRYLQRLRKQYVRRSRVIAAASQLPLPEETTALLAPEAPAPCPPPLTPQSPTLEIPGSIFLGHGGSSERLLRSSPSSPVNSTASSGGYISHESVSGPRGTNSEGCQVSVESNGPPTLNTYTINKDVQCIENGGIPRPESIECVLDSDELHSFAKQIADGMRHLASKNITHRDLAARNVLIDETKTLKISDFGLSRMGVYRTLKGGRVPLRWLSIEAIRFDEYSSASDVWSYGVVLWEICTLGGFPYPTIADEDLPKYLDLGRRLAKPDNCSQEMYDVMQTCWSSDPADRPSFDRLCLILHQMTEQASPYVNFDLLGDMPLPPSEEDVNKKKRYHRRPSNTNKMDP